eukprot:1865492-Karenia_brevis.AAC.1
MFFVAFLRCLRPGPRRASGPGRDHSRIRGSLSAHKTPPKASIRIKGRGGWAGGGGGVRPTKRGAPR